VYRKSVCLACSSRLTYCVIRASNLVQRGASIPEPAREVSRREESVKKSRIHSLACCRRSDSGARTKNIASERAEKNEGRLGKGASWSSRPSAARRWTPGTGPEEVGHSPQGITGQIVLFSVATNLEGVRTLIKRRFPLQEALNRPRSKFIRFLWLVTVSLQLIN